MNTVCLIGRLARDPRISTIGKGKDAMTAARFTVAVDRYEKDPDWVPCSCVGSRADFVDKYLKKGMRIAVTGSIHTFQYTTEDDETVYSWEIYADRIEFADSKKEDPEDPEDQE